MPVVRELITKLGFDADTSGADKFEKSLGGLKKAAMALAAAGAAAGTALYAMASEVAAAGDAAAKQSRIFGLSIQSYQELGHAAEQSGTDIVAVTDVMKDLSKNAYEAAKMGNVAFGDMFKELGVTLTDSEGKLRTQEELFLDVAEGMKNLTDDTKRLAYAEKLLGGSGKLMQNMFLAGRDGIEAMRQEARDLGIVLSDDVALQSEVFGDSIDEVKKALKGVRYTIGASVMPAISEYAQGLRDWFIAHREIIAQNLSAVLKGLVSALSALVQPIIMIIGWMKKLADAMGGVAKIAKVLKAAIIGLVATKVLLGLKLLATAALGVGGGFKAAALWAKAARVAIFALIVAVGLIAEDIYRFFTGAESVSGRIMDWLETSDHKIAAWYRNNIRPIFEWIADKLHAFIEALDVIGGKAAAIREVGQALGLTKTEAQAQTARRAEMAASLSGEERTAIEQRAKEVGAARGLSEREIRRMALQMAERQVTRRTSNANLNVGEVKVTVQGTTGMNAEEMKRAVNEGVREGLAKPLRDLQAAGAGGVE